MKEKSFERITVSLPSTLAEEVRSLMDELNISKSDVLKIAVEKFSREYKKEKLRKIVEEMKDEYKNNKKLTEFTVLDGEDFL